MHVRVRIKVADMIAVIAAFLARRQNAPPMAGCVLKRTVVGHTSAEIVVQAHAV